MYMVITSFTLLIKIFHVENEHDLDFIRNIGELF